MEGCAGTEVGRSAAKQHRGSRQQALASFVRTAWLNCTSAGAQLPNLPAIKPPVGGGRGLRLAPLHSHSSWYFHTTNTTAK